MGRSKKKKRKNKSRAPAAVATKARHVCTTPPEPTKRKRQRKENPDALARKLWRKCLPCGQPSPPTYVHLVERLLIANGRRTVQLTFRECYCCLLGRTLGVRDERRKAAADARTFNEHLEGHGAATSYASAGRSIEERETFAATYPDNQKLQESRERFDAVHTVPAEAEQADDSLVDVELTIFNLTCRKGKRDGISGLTDEGRDGYGLLEDDLFRLLNLIEFIPDEGQRIATALAWIETRAENDAEDRSVRV